MKDRFCVLIFYISDEQGEVADKEEAYLDMFAIGPIAEGVTIDTQYIMGLDTFDSFYEALPVGLNVFIEVFVVVAREKFENSGSEESIPEKILTGLEEMLDNKTLIYKDDFSFYITVSEK